jgi:transposase-like protein
MRLGIQIRLVFLSLSDTVSILYESGIERARSTVRSWVHEVDHRSETGRCPDRVAVDETVVRLNDGLYRPCAAVDPETDELLHARLEPTTARALAHSFLTELSENHALIAVSRPFYSVATYRPP